MTPKLRLTNTYSRQQEVFTPIQAEQVFLYVCGITPYDYAHIGHARCYISFDVLVKALQFLGYQTTYIRNYTDIDDKLLNKARENGNEMSYGQIAQIYIQDFELQMQRLGCQTPTIQPRATQCIDEMITIISKLLDQGYAYQLGYDVYFDIAKLDRYGQLSGKNIDELNAGARIELDQSKRNAGDFVLWKGNDEQKFWPAPFGYGRPGWHIECSAMINKHCPKRPLDIHAGGYDLIFPHHENEIAQSESANGYKLANFWLHNAFVNIGKEKMSKSLGNSVNLKQLFENHVDPMVFRFYILQHSYTKPLELCLDSLKGSKKPFERLAKLFGQTPQHPKLTHTSLQQQLQNQPTEAQEFFDHCISALLDDLNTSAVLGLIFKHFDEIEAWQNSNKQLLGQLLTQVLGLDFTPQQATQDLTPEALELITRRDQARANKDFALADQLRDELKRLGVDVQDRKL